MRPAVVLAAAAVPALFAGCGSQRAAPPQPPRLPHVLATAWRNDADAVAAALAVGDACLAQQRATALQSSVIAAINARRVAAQFRESLQSAVNDLRSRIHCVPPPAPSEHHEHGKHKGHDEGDD